MTTRAYQEIYLSKAQSALGDAFDYAINTCHILGTVFPGFLAARLRICWKNRDSSTLQHLNLYCRIQILELYSRLLRCKLPVNILLS